MKSFYSFFEQANVSATQPPERISDSLMMTAGKHQPPHAGHGLLLDQASDLAEALGADERYYTSRSQDRENNPLPVDLKHKFLKSMFPKHANKWDTDDSIKTILQALSKADNDGYKDVRMMVGADRQPEVANLTRKLLGDLYDFDNLEVLAADEHDEEDPLGQITAGGLRNHALKDNSEKFMEGMPINKKFTSKHAKEVMDALKMYGVQNEQLDINDLRQLYTEGLLYNVGDEVESLNTGLRGKIHRCGANHLIVVTEEGIMFKSFIQDVYTVS